MDSQKQLSSAALGTSHQDSKQTTTFDCRASTEDASGSYSYA